MDPGFAERTTPRFRSFDDTEIVFDQWGSDERWPWVALHHGFIAHAKANWVEPGIVDALVAAGRRVTALDARGHGRSEKPRDPARYGEAAMARDLSALFDLLDEPQVDLVGYSMGAIVSLITASQDPRVARLVVGGVGCGVIECGGVDTRVMPSGSLVAALRVEDPATIRHPTAAAMRAFADLIKADREALAMQCAAVHQAPIAVGAITAPTLVLAGDEDPLATRPEVLAEAIPGARLEIVHGDHLGAVPNPALIEHIVEFLTR